MKYKVGDRVRIKTGLKSQTRSGVRLNPKMRKWEGKVMTIESVSNDLYRMLEDIGEPCTGLGWAWGEDWIEGRANDFKIVITTEGDSVLARLYEGKKVLEEAKATCSKDDKFVFGTGAQLAFDRLLGNEPKKEEWFTGKMVRVHDLTLADCSSKGKVYYFKDGYETDRNGRPCHDFHRYHSAEEISIAYLGHLVPLIE
nr:MAG TPA: hypothetical protein [Caudoviricetes sp.]